MARDTDALISVDTYRAETARLAVEAGAHIVNDVHGLQREPDIARIAAQTGAGLCINHTGRDRQKLADVVEDQFHFLDRSLQIAAEADIERERIVLDPGFGFAKDTEENLELMARFAELHRFERPFLVGTSRKRFLGAVTGRKSGDHDAGCGDDGALTHGGCRHFPRHDVGKQQGCADDGDAMLDAKKS